jgi:hypothetical protein
MASKRHVMQETRQHNKQLEEHARDGGSDMAFNPGFL